LEKQNGIDFRCVATIIIVSRFMDGVMLKEVECDAVVDIELGSA
jgi:hypothetical protein